MLHMDGILHKMQPYCFNPLVDDIFHFFTNLFPFKGGVKYQITPLGGGLRDMCEKPIRQGVIQPDTREEISRPLYEIYMVKITRNVTKHLNCRAEAKCFNGVR